MAPKTVTLGMVKLWEQMLNEAVAGVMSRVKIVEARNEHFARKQVEDELGITSIREALEKAEKIVEDLRDQLAHHGVGSNAWRNSKAKDRYEQLVTQRTKELHIAEVAAFVAEVNEAKEQVRLAVLPDTVRAILDSVKKTSEKLVPRLIAAEKQSQKMLRAMKIIDIEE